MTGFDLDRITSKVRSFRMTVNDCEMVTPTLAKVVLNMTGVPDSMLEVRTAIAQIFKGEASAVENSFRWANRKGDLKSVVGYVKANNAVREYNEKSESNKYRAMASNLLMDQEDRSLWEVRSGAGDAKYLVREGNDDLSSLIHLATSYRRINPKVNEIASASPATTEVVGFVDRVTEEVRHGFVVATNKNAGTVTVLATDSEDPLDVPETDVIDVFELDSDEQEQLSTTAAASGMSKEAMISYYRKAYSYSPEYIQEIINTINQHAFA
jgi:hypothetical protein